MGFSIIRRNADFPERQIRKDNAETVRIRIPHPGLLGEALIDLNKALLSRLSTYYKAAFHSGFSESAQKIFDMDICAEDMHSFKTWLRDGRLTFRWDKLTLEQIIRLYIFADYYDFPALRRTIMTKLVLDKYGDRANTRLLTYKVEGYLSELPPASPLYQWLAMVWAHHVDAHSYSSQAYRLENETPEEFRNLVHSIRSSGTLPRVCKCCYRPCDYHEHESEQEWETSECISRVMPGPYADVLQQLATCMSTSQQNLIRLRIASHSRFLEWNIEANIFNNSISLAFVRG